MERKQIQKELKAALALNQQAKELLEKIQNLVEGSDGEPVVLSICRYCKESIYEGQDTQREVHIHCYSELYRMVEAGVTTLDELFAKGLIGPKGKPGRKPSVAKKAMKILEQASQMAAEDDGTKTKKKRPGSPKKKGKKE